jgi:hypothetical protein
MHGSMNVKFFHLIYLSIGGSGPARAPEVTCWFLTSEAQIQPHDSPWKMWGMLDKVALAKVLLQVLQFFFTYNPSTNDPYLFIMRN